jgi:hypothetical protein
MVSMLLSLLVTSHEPRPDAIPEEHNRQGAQKSPGGRRDPDGDRMEIERQACGDGCPEHQCAQAKDDQHL